MSSNEEQFFAAMTDEEKVISFSRTFGASTQEILDKIITVNFEAGLLNSTLVEKIRAYIKNMSDEEKIAGAVDFLFDADLDNPDNRKKLAEIVVPNLLDRIIAGIKERQAMQSFFPIFNPGSGMRDND